MSAPQRLSVPRRRSAAKSNMFPHTVTVYTTAAEVDKETLEDRLTQHITILRGVLLDERKAANVRQSGLESADAVTLYIPFSVDARDGVTGEEKRYAPPVAFWNAADRSGLWTLAVGSTFFVRGEVVEPDRDVQFIEMKYDGVYDVTKVDVKDFGSPDMQHWEVGGA